MKTYLITSLLVGVICFTGPTQFEDAPMVKADITVVCLLVKDHDEAIAYYTDKLGFAVTQDQQYAPGRRWVTLASGEGAAVELSLGLAGTDEERSIVGNQAGNYPFFVLFTENIQEKYDELRSNGVQFEGELARGPGGMGATFRDLYGNLIYLRGK